MLCDIPSVSVPNCVIWEPQQTVTLVVSLPAAPQEKVTIGLLTDTRIAVGL